MIIRTVHDKSNPYFQLNRSAVNDERLSYKAVGIHSYLMSKPDGWEANETDIVNRHTEGRDSVRSGLKELAECGYLHRTRVTDDRGRVVEWRIDVYETPNVNPYFVANSAIDGQSEPEAQVTEKPQLDNQSSGSPDDWKPTLWKSQNVENPTHSNNRYIENNELKEEKTQAESPEIEPPAPLPLPAPLPVGSTGDPFMDAAKARFARGGRAVNSWQAELNLRLSADKRVPLVNAVGKACGLTALMNGDDETLQDVHKSACWFYESGYDTKEKVEALHRVYLSDDWRRKNHPRPSLESFMKFASAQLDELPIMPMASVGGGKPSGSYIGKVENLR